MSKQLIIAEKPSVAQDIARALGGFTRHGDYFESDQYVLSSAIGHLLELVVPEGYEVKRGKWSFAHLPVIPPEFALAPIDKTEDRLKLLVRLMRRKDVEGLVNACDAGREGELIFNYIARHGRAAKPVRRLWLQSMTPQAIRDGFARLREGAEMDGLRDAAVCRSEADWLIGINGTRAMTAFNSKTGGFHLTTVGRVQTPTLAIVVEREARIRAFQPRDYWEVEAGFAAQAGNYRGRWFDERFRRNEADEHARAERLWDEARARGIAARCTGRPGTVEEECKPATQIPPLLYDLTSLQREANGRFGFSARNTLALAQALYERHKVLTYPRTDSRALPEDYLATVRGTLQMFAGEEALKGADHALLHNYREFAARILDQGWVRPNKRIFDNAKISDHFAIIPTGLAPKSLSEPEAKLYDLVAKRFLAVFFPAAESLVTTRITRVEGESFKSEGRILVNAGWLAVYGREAQKRDDTPQLPLVAVGEVVKTEAVDVTAHQTKPPARYTEATLLTAMEGAGKLVDDEELRAAMAGRGLGTPATRAQIIENLIAEVYMLREGRELVPTAKAFSLITLLRGLQVPELISPELTGEWEHKLARMERGELPRPAFMQQIAEMTRHIVEQAKSHESDTVPGDFATLSTPCPKCGGVVRETYKKFQCQGCDLALWKIAAGRQYEIAEMETLLSERKIGPLTGFRTKIGRPFAASVRLNDEFQPEFDFGQDKAEEGEAGAVDFGDQEPLGACPKCGGRVFEHGMAYVCEHCVGADKRCDFRSGKVILQQAVDRAQMTRLLAAGRTDLLRGFVSARTRRKFSAFLVRASDGKVGFEFEARKKPAASAAKAAGDGAAEAKPARRGARAAAADETAAKPAAAPRRRAAGK
ncbi:MAG: DNA topoisomerase III [Betaproteobacteria bacterium]|nr:DNA topoisomerase III [Betaproteobacteria bacterium]